MKLLLTILFATVCYVVEAQYRQTIRGTVVDEVTKIALPAATITVESGDELLGAISDEDGDFEVKNIEVGLCNVKVTFMGYEPYFLRNVELNSGKEKVLIIELTEQVIDVDEFVVRAYNNGETINKMAALSAKSFSVKQTEKYAGSWGDPSRMVSNFAGVIVANDSRNDIIIRGNSPQGLLWRLEGISIPNPNHFGALGSTGGPVSILNNNLLSNSDFFTGAFPAEYGNALSGVFDLKMRNGNNQKHEFVGQIGFNGFEVGAEGPLSKNHKASYMANYRYSVLSLMDKIGFYASGSGVPEYQDVTVRLNLPTKKFGTFSVIGIAGDSNIEFEPDGEDGTFNVVDDTRTRNGSKMGVLGVTHRFFINNKSSIYSTVSGTYQCVTTRIDSVLSNDREKIYYGEKNAETRLGITSKYTRKINSKHTVDFGIELQSFGINYLDSVDGESLSPPVYGTYVRGLDTKKNNMNLFEAYTEWQYRFNASWTFYAGLHGQYYFYNSTGNIEPRLSITYVLPNFANLSFAYGKHAQIQPNYIYLFKTYDRSTGQYSETNNDLEMTKARHFVLGYNQFVTDNIKLSLESYFQQLYDIPVTEEESVFSMVNAGSSFHQAREDSLVNDGLARNYGLELTLEKYLSNHYYFLLTTSLFDSKYRASDMKWRNTEFNTQYVVNALVGYELPLREKYALDINLRMISSGGKRDLYIDLEKSIEAGETEYDDSKAYSRSGNPYFRLDARIALKMNAKRFTQEWALDITNLTNHKNLYATSYDAKEEKIEKIYQQGFYPMFLYRINF